MEIKKMVLIRPYSLGYVFSIGLIAHILMNQGLVIGLPLFIDLAVPALIWGSILLIVEAKHKQQYRPKVRALDVAILFVPLVVLMFFREPLSILLLLVGIPLAYLYSLKTHFSFIIRGLKEVLMFLIVLMFYLHSFSILIETISNEWILIFIVYLLPTSRNLIGDLRDIKEDKHTFARFGGSKLTRTISCLFLVLVIYLAPSILIAVPVLLAIPIIFLSSDGYLLHKMMIFSTTAVLLNYIFYMLSYSLFISNLFFIGFSLMASYDYMPRKSNIQYLEGVIKWVKRKN